jgi:hypothetical protein
MKKERRMIFLAAVMLMSAALISACGMNDLPCLLGDCPDADTCGNGVVDVEEICDTAIQAGQPGACPTTCTAPDGCTTSTLQDTGTCTAKCIDAAIVPCCGNNLVEDGEECDPPAAGTCSAACKTCIDQTGTWITRITATGTFFSAPDLIGTLQGTLDMVQRMVVTKSNGSLIYQVDICSLSTNSSSPYAFEIVYSPTVIGTLTTTITEPDQCLRVGDPITLPIFTINTGWGGPPIPTTNTCPTPGTAGFPVTSCSGSVDSDEDGVYGITLPTRVLNGLFLVTAYAGLTITIEQDGMILTESATNTGTANVSLVGFMFGCTDGTMGPFNITPSSTAVPVTLVRLLGDVSCSEVLTHCTGPTCVP